MKIGVVYKDLNIEVDRKEKTGRSFHKREENNKTEFMIAKQ